MLKLLNQFLRQTFIYSISNVAVKAVGFVLIPLYTAYLSVSEFGQWGVIDATIIILVEVMPLGLTNAILFISNSKDYRDQRESGFSSIIAFQIIFNTIFIILFEITISLGIWESIVSEEFFSLLHPSVWIIVIRVINSLFLTKLRADERSVAYTIINVVKLFFLLCFAIFFITSLKLGVLGILYAYLISELIGFMVIISVLVPHMRFTFEKDILSFSFRFGLPFVFSSIGIMLLNLSDRYILKLLTDYETIGLYDLGYRFAGILNMFLIIPFGYTFLPIAYKIFGQKDDKRYYTKLMTYLTFVLVWSGLALSLFSREIIENFTFNQAYHSAYIVVPVIILAYIFSGMRNIALLGMLLTKNTKYIAYITLFVATLNVIFNFIFIPIWGMMVAAYSTLAAFIVYYFLSVKISDRFYKIPFEHKKLLLLLMLGVGLYVVTIFVSGINFLILVILKLFLILIFPIVLYYLKFYEEVELKAIMRYYKSAKNFVSKTIIRLKGKE